jgi:phospholipase C
MLVGHTLESLGYFKPTEVSMRTTPLTAAQVLWLGLTFGASPVIAQSQGLGTTTPIRHLVVIFQENVSFDHYFGTYPNALNPQGEPKFTALPNTPAVNGLTGGLMIQNPNMMNPANGEGGTNPWRLGRSQASTADQNHNYGAEQAAVHGGLMDMYPIKVGVAGAAGSVTANISLNMGFYDGNTVTALWNYAQRFAMSDNSYSTNYGPSTPGAINLIAGQTHGVIGNINGTGAVADAGDGTFTDIGDADPIGDVCSTTTGELFSMAGQNVGDLLNAANASWGFFTQGFDLTITNGNGTTGCARATTSLITNQSKADYIPHHEPFQYYKSTANPTHARPKSVATIGFNDTANHQYDMHDFYDAVNAGNFPAVNFLKAAGYQDGHPGYSDPLDEQQFIVHVINFLQKRPEWADTAVVILYDDSDGWYDHQMPPVVNQSTSSADQLTGPGACGDGSNALPGVGGMAHAQGRCGYGPRQPLLVISPWAKQNFVDHTITDQTSVLRFIEDNWLNEKRIGNGSFDALANSIANMFDFTSDPNLSTLILDETSGMIVK